MPNLKFQSLRSPGGVDIFLNDFSMISTLVKQVFEEKRKIGGKYVGLEVAPQWIVIQQRGSIKFVDVKVTFGFIFKDVFIIT